NTFKPEDFTVYDVFYGDCAAPWTFCYHKDVERLDAIQNFGRTPVRMRQWAAVIAIIPERQTGEAAHQAGNTLVYHGTATGHPAIDVHELAHFADFWKTDTSPVGSKPYSWWSRDNNTWRSKVVTDQSLASEYSRRSFMESFAEIGIMASYDVATNGGLGAAQPRWTEFRNQLQTYREYMGDDLIPSGRCTKMTPQSPLV
ncbi:hypothetical protein B0T14DRAFT_409312, partial [Immersiella caudata]